MSDVVWKKERGGLWREALQTSFPIAMGYLPAGMAFGVLASAAGIPWWLSLFISLITYSGAAQYAAIPLIASGAGVINIALNTFVINLRHVFYALPLLKVLPKRRHERWYCLFALTDECFSLMTTLPEEKQRTLFSRIALLCQSYWVFATLLGVMIGGKLNELIPHLDFALASLFVILWFEQMRLKRVVWPTMLAIISYLGVLFIYPQQALLLALIICVIAILIQSMILNHLREQA